MCEFMQYQNDSVAIKIGDKELKLEIGKFAQQANAAVIATIGETVVHATIVMGGTRDDIDWFPLHVEYQEKLYAGGKIKGSRWVKRDGRPTDDVILKARIIDRSIRPLFPEGFKNDVQVIITVLSADGENDADMAAIYAVTTGLMISDVPWAGPLGGVRVGYNSEEKKLIANPTYEERETSDLDLIISASKDAVVMVESGANEISEDTMLEAFDFAHKTVSNSLDQLTAFVEKNSQTKLDFTPVVMDKDLLKKVTADAGDKINEFIEDRAATRKPAVKELTEELFAKYEEEVSKKDIAKALDLAMKYEIRRKTSEEGVRPGGRTNEQIRTITSEVGVLPRTHGSGMFKRGATQGLTITTLGSPSLNQLIESMEGEENKRYIHHYNMPPFTVGETGRVGWPSRREVGHGALAERALMPMIPSEEEFPYTIHVVTEIMSSNGSTSMASVCGSTLSLMDAGVPLKKPVSGIAMGLIRENGKYTILSDIMGLEDFTGDMDFKVAGTRDGITAMQMDIKIDGIPMDVMKQALNQAKVGRLHIMDEMLVSLDAPRQTLSQYAPKIETVQVPVDRIGEIIGPGGKIIKEIIKETGADVDVNDEGSVFISSTDQEAIDAAKTWVTGIVREVEIGEEFDGKVVRIENYGAFVNILPGKDGLLHVSNMSAEYVSDVNSLVKMDQEVHVRVNEVTPEGKIGLTTLTAEQEAAKKSRGNGGGGRPPRRNGGGDRDRRGGGRPPRRDSRPARN